MEMDPEGRLNLQQNRTLRLCILLLMVPLSGATIDIYVPSLPAITNHFGGPVQLVQWTIPSYLIGYSLAQLFCGAFSDAWGRRALLIIGLGLYTGSSLLAASSPSVTVLILVRFLQGLGVAAPGVLARAIASDSFESERLPAITNYITLAWALGPILAPLIGGYLQHVFGWKAVFYFLTGYGCLVLILVSFLLPETNTRRHPLRVDTLLDHYKSVLESPVFLGCALVLAIIYSHLILFNVVGPFLVQVVLNESPLVFGRVALGLGLAWFLGSLANRFLTVAFPRLPLMEIATIVAFVGSLLMGWLAIRYALSLFNLIIPSAIVFMSGSITFTQCFGKSMRLFPERAGTVSALMGTLFIAGSALAGFAGSFLETRTAVPLALSFVVLTFLVALIQRTMKLSKDSLDHGERRGDPAAHA
jgi:DHA1 family bicyclomycin/chloramphenicol resistance-like MFS transporter